MHTVASLFLIELAARIKSLVFTLLLLSLTLTVNGQYFQFSQYNFTDQRVNPAMIGTTRYASLGAVYRNQKTGGDFNLNSNFISVAYPLLNQSTGRPWSGIGLTMMDDRSAGIYKTQEVTASYAINIKIGRAHV